MDNKTLHDRFRSQLTNVHALTVLTVSVLEIIGYIVLVRSGVEQFALSNHYLWYGVVFPIVVNTATHLIARIVVSRPNVDRKTKNGSIIAAALITSFIVAIIHKEYSVTGCAYIFPIVLSAMFNDKKLLNTGLIASLAILLCVGGAFWLDGNVTLTNALNLFILFGFAFVAYLCGIISINFSNQNYTTIESQAQTCEELRDDILRDQMNKLYNHATYFDHLEQTVSTHTPDDPLCLVMLDLDYFKQINDKYGHPSGDAVLLFAADTFRRHCTEPDMPYRYGGEEFALLFHHKTAEDVTAIMQEILDEFRAHRFDFSDAPVTFSAGVVQYTDSMSANLFFKTADQTMYDAKEQGKNRILTR